MQHYRFGVKATAPGDDRQLREQLAAALEEHGAVDVQVEGANDRPGEFTGSFAAEAAAGVLQDVVRELPSPVHVTWEIPPSADG
jgi:hypothetical protein